MKIIGMLLLLILTINLTAIAQVSDSVAFSTELTELTVIGAIRADEKTPVTLKNFDLPQIEKYSFGQELPTLLNSTQSVTAYSDAGSYFGYTYFRLRGIDQSRINFTLNGIPLNEPEDQGVYFNNFVDFSNSIQSMQIQRGVGTSTNGVASFAGSINFQSISLANPKIELQYSLASFNTNRFSLEYCTGIQNNYSIYMRYSDVNSDGYRYNSSNNSQSFYFSGGLFYDKDILNFTSFYGHQQNQMAYLATSIYDIEIDPRTNYLSPDERDEFKYFFNSFQYIRQLDNYTTMTASLFYIKLDGNYDYLYSPDIYNYRLNSNFYGTLLNVNHKSSNWRIDGGVALSYYDRRHTSIIETIEENLYDNTGYKNETSIFTKISYDFDVLTFYGDLQFRNVRFTYYDDIAVAPITWNFLNPKIGILYNVSKNIIYYASVGMTQREPNRLDMLQGYDDIDEYNYIDVGDLTQVKPEKVIDIEGGIKFDYDKIKFDINGFSMQFENEIAPIGKLSEIYGLPLRKNVPASSRTGVEIDLLWQVTDKFKIENNTTFMTANIDKYTTEYDSITYENAVPLLTPKTISNTAFNYDLNLFNVSIIGKYASQSYLDNENTVVMPQYFIWDFVLQVKFWEHVFDFRVNNVTNQQYYTSGYVGEPGVPYYYIQMPLNFIGTLKLKF